MLQAAQPHYPSSSAPVAAPLGAVAGVADGCSIGGQSDGSATDSGRGSHEESSTGVFNSTNKLLC